MTCTPTYTYGFLCDDNDPIIIGKPVMGPTVLSEMIFGLRRMYLARMDTVTSECIPVYDMGCFHNNCQWCFYHTDQPQVVGSSHLKVEDMIDFSATFTPTYEHNKRKYTYLCRIEPNIYMLNAKVRVKFMVKEPSVRYLVSPCHHLTVGDTYTSLDLAGSILYDKEGALRVAKNTNMKTTIYEVEPNGLSLRILSKVQTTEPFAIRAANTRVKILTAIDEIILAASSDTDMVFDIETRSHGEHGLGIKIGIIQTED